MNNKQEVINMVCILVGVILIFISGYNLHKWDIDMDKNCSTCITKECQDYDSICGDFGYYYWKLIGNTMLVVFSLGLILGPNISGKVDS